MTRDPGNPRFRRTMVLLVSLLVCACASPTPEAPTSGPYPFGPIRDVSRTEAARRARLTYPEVFRVIDDPARTEDIDPRGLRRDLARVPVEERNYGALHAIAVAFFALHARAEQDRGRDRYFAYSFQATKMVAIPWRLYGEIPDPRLRSAILDFYEDVMFGSKDGLGAVRGRYTRLVADLERKEVDPVLRARIAALVERGRDLRPER